MKKLLHNLKNVNNALDNSMSWFYVLVINNFFVQKKKKKNHDLI